MPDTSKPQKTRVFESAASELHGVRLKAMNDQDLDVILGRARNHPAVVSAARREGLPLTREVILRLIALLKDL